MPSKLATEPLMLVSLRQVIVAVVIAVIVASITFLAGWTLDISSRVTKIETRYEATSERVLGLENGITTPMSREAVAKFADVLNQLTDMKVQIRNLSEAQDEIVRLLLDRKAEGKSKNPQGE